ncbi:helix-turn-helix transcriptional regulator [bacterium]|nr:helix-turn-helix transcriptional regulator [bacterium]
MIDFIRVGRKLTNYRKKLQLTQDDVAERLFVTRQLVSKWENGTGVPSIDCLLELCKLYNTTFEDILCLDGE